MTDKDKGSDLFDMIDRGISLYENNKDVVEGIVSGSSDVTIDDEEPLKQAFVDEDKAEITVDVGVDDIKDIRLALNGTEAHITVGGTTITADVPADVIMEDARAELNNGVLKVEIPRRGGEE
jgi:HSP20 family molecular chaperone IbpA